jgi:hypothetical protein
VLLRVVPLLRAKIPLLRAKIPLLRAKIPLQIPLKFPCSPAQGNLL